MFKSNFNNSQMLSLHLIINYVKSRYTAQETFELIKENFTAKGIWCVPLIDERSYPAQSQYDGSFFSFYMVIDTHIFHEQDKIISEICSLLKQNNVFAVNGTKHKIDVLKSEYIDENRFEYLTSSNSYSQHQSFRFQTLPNPHKPNQNYSISHIPMINQSQFSYQQYPQRVIKEQSQDDSSTSLQSQIQQRKQDLLIESNHNNEETKTKQNNSFDDDKEMILKEQDQDLCKDIFSQKESYSELHKELKEQKKINEDFRIQQQATNEKFQSEQRKFDQLLASQKETYDAKMELQKLKLEQLSKEFQNLQQKFDELSVQEKERKSNLFREQEICFEKSKYSFFEEMSTQIKDLVGDLKHQKSKSDQKSEIENPEKKDQ